MIVASGLLALVVGAAFAVLLTLIAQLHGSEADARRSEQVLVAANLLERLVVDLETGQRGFVITGQDDFLEPWHAARAAFPEQATALEQLVADNPEQQARAQRIAQAGKAYIDDYSVPLIDTARLDLASAQTVTATADGKRRVDEMRAELDRFVEAERDVAAARLDRSEAAARIAIVAAAGGLAGSILLIVVFAVYLSRSIVQPVREAAGMASRLAAGDFGARLAERGVGEIGVLRRSFNTMASSLEQGRADLSASRARIVAASDQARRRIERDLHDGTQQRLVSLVLDLRAAEAGLPPELQEPKAQLARVADGLTGALDDLRDISRGIHPAILSEGGLGPALKALGRRSVVPVELDLDVLPRLEEPVEVAAYYVVAEALANAAKHARASAVWVTAEAGGGRLHLSVRDDGIGGAALGSGSGLTGLTDRVEALGGTIVVTSPPGQGTTLQVDLPIQGR